VRRATLPAEPGADAEPAAPSCSSTAQLGMGPVIVDLKLTDIVDIWGLDN
jgi:hypothetical protein